MLHARPLFPTVLLCLALTAALSACSGNDSANARKPPAPQVGFVVMQPQTVAIETILSGRVVAAETSEVRPQITGLIRKRLFAEGATVRAGQPLFEIDPRLYRASVDEANANLASARATAEAASAKADRFKPLAEIEAVAKQDYADALAQARQARAAIAQNGAQLETARINLRFTTVPAPIGGKIGRSLFTVGALVSANQVNPLAVIQRLDSVFVDMQQSSAELLTMRRALSSGGALPGSTAVRLRLEDGSDYAGVGRVEFSEVMVNAQTGTVTLRARFPNPDGVLLPGMFVQARFDQARDASAYLVPQQALQRDLGGEAFVFLVGANNKTIRRTVRADRTSGANWVVTDGLARGDKVITQGTNGLRADAEVRPVPASSPQRIAPPAKGADGAPARKQGG